MRPWHLYTPPVVVLDWSLHRGLARLRRLFRHSLFRAPSGALTKLVQYAVTRDYKSRNKVVGGEPPSGSFSLFSSSWDFVGRSPPSRGGIGRRNGLLSSSVGGPYPVPSLFPVFFLSLLSLHGDGRGRRMTGSGARRGCACFSSLGPSRGWGCWGVCGSAARRDHLGTNKYSRKVAHPSPSALSSAQPVIPRSVLR